MQARPQMAMMAESVQTRLAWPRGLRLPVLLAAAILLLATAGLRAGWPAPTPDAAPERTEQARAVDRAGDAMSGALDDACRLTGCRSGDLHPMVAATAAAMEAGELQQALDAQARLLAETERRRAAAPPDSRAQRTATAEIAAAEHIAALYRAELARR